MDRGLSYPSIDITKAGLYVYVDASFANNKDLSSQIGYLIVLANEEPHNAAFKMRGSIVHWSSTKCKRVTRSVLASEIYAMTAGFDMGYSMMSTINDIVRTLNKQHAELKIPAIPLILLTDSYSLYETITKLGTLAEKRLMIDVMALRESYEGKEINEIRWINGEDNPADALTKSTPNRALEKLVTGNEIVVRIEGEVFRKARKT
jgi:hypothetical protein